MKRIVLYLVLSISLFGKTLVVDQSFFSIYGTGINCEGFSVNTYETIQAAVDDAQDGDTIKVCPGEYNESINWNKQNISLIGTSGNRDDVLISQQDEKVLSILSWPKSVTIKNVTLESKQDDAIYVNNEPPSSALFENVSIKAGKNGIRAELYISDFHLKNSYIYSKNEKGVYFKDNTNGDFLIEGSLIESKEEGISVKNTNGEMKIYDSNIISSNEKCLEVDGSVQNGLELKNLILQGDKGVYIKNNLNGQILFQNISIQSSDESIQIDESISQQLKLKELNITSNNNNGVEVGGSLNGGLLLENSSITSNNSYGISIKKSVSNGVLINNSNIVGKDGSIRFLENVSGDITIQSSNFNSQNKKGIKFEKNINHKLTISQSIISSNDDSLSIDGSINGGLLIEDTNITSNSEDGLQVKGNIYGDIDGNYDLSIKNSNIKAKKRALNLKYEKQIDAKLENSYFESSNDDTVKLKLTDWKSVLATGNCFKTLGSGDYAFYLDMDNSNDVHINNNCFYATTIDRLAKSTSSGYDWDGNYWDGLTESSYNYNNVVDNNPLSSCQNSCGESNTNNNILQPIVNYQMDECRWDADSSTYEIKNSGTLSNDYNASSLNNADTTLEGVLCKAADIISNEDDDKAIETKTEVSLPTEYTLVTWVKFPLNTDGHKTFRYGAGPFAINIQYYNIADRVGSDNDFIYFTRNVNEDSWTLNVKDDNSKDSIDFNPQSLSGWHMLTFVVTNSGTEFYLDDSKNYTFSTHPNSGTLGLLFNSDYGSSDNDPNGQSIGAYVDEFKIFNQDIDEDKITEIYNNEKSGKNYDGSIRDCPSCATSELPIVNYQMDECRWDADSSTYEIKNSGTLSNDYNASSLNNADTTLEGVLCKAADIISNEDDDKAIETKTEVSLPTEYTLVTWVKFPLNTDGHKTFRYGAGPFAINIQYYNIADRVGSDNDFIYFTRNVNEDSWTLNVKDDNSKDSIDFNPQSLSGWHMLTFVVTNSGTEFYLDDSKNYTFSTHPNSGTLGLLFNSDYGSSDNDPNGQSIGAYVDEFKIFNQDIDEDKITEIYNNEKSGKNYDGSIRDCPSCATSKVPIAYYKMDECYWDGTEGEVKDSSGNEHNGTAKYGLNTDYGHLCLAGEFDGDNDYIDTGYDFYWSRDENFTITAWVYIDDVDEYEYIPVFSKMNRKEYSLMIGKRLRFLYRDNSEHDALFIWNTGTVFESKKWYQIAVVYDGETKEPKIYVNGKDDGTYIYKNDKDMSFGHTTETTKIGHGFAWGNEYFDGKIDEVRVYDAALSSDDINATYNDEKDGKVCEANNCLPKPIANWRLDECKWTGAEGEVRDTALSGFDGTVEGEANTIDGKKCKSGIFDGDNDYIEIPHDEGLNPSNNRYTIMAWVKTNDNFKTTLIAGKGDWRGHSIGQDKYHGWFTQFYFSDGSHSTVLWGNDKPEVGRWYHIAGVYDGSSVKLYIDGELANSENVSKELDKNSKPFWIAAAGWQKRFNGQIDEVKVFDENLSAEQIQRIYNNEDSGKNFDGGNRYCKDCSITLKLDYHLDECSEWIGEDGEIKDSSGNSYDGVAVNGAKNKDNGKVCKTSNLNEGRTSPGEYTPYNGKYINTKQNFQWDRDKSFTMMAWVYPRQQWCPIIAKVNPDYNHRDQKEFKLEVGVSNNVNRFRFEQTLEGHDYIHIYTAGQELNKWYHVAVVYDSDTRDIFLYLNGENAGHVYRNDKDKEFIHYNFPVTIGKGYSSYKDDELNYCDGMIDEIKIFDGALDHSMISIIYNREKSGKYWNSDEECPTCFSFKFDAWDTWRGDINDDGVIDDKNISTKVVYQDFNLSIASLSEDGNSLRDFNGTVCAILIDSNDKNYTSWKKMDEFTNDVNISNWTGIKVSKAVNQLKTKIVWKKDVNESCPLVEEDGNTTSTDEFAVRPNRFETYTISEVYSGEEFNITFNALDIGVNNVLDYNETRDNSFEVNVKSINNCIDNELNNSWSFSNGKYVYENVKFINVGEINITIKEINGSEFANVDADDTNDSDRFIEENITTIYVRPYELKVSEVQLKPSTQNGNWLYMAHELSDMNVESNVTIEALSKDGSLIEDFNDTCYDKNLVIKVKFDYFENNKDENISYLFDGNLTDTNEPNVTLQIPIYKFKEGIATASYKFGIDRDFSDPKNPLLLELREVNITNNDEIKAKVVNGMNITDENVTFYYGRIKFKDIRTTEKDINNTGYVLVYSENKLDGFIQYSSNWYINKNHSDIKEGNITNAEAHENTVLASSEKSDINISSEEPNEGKINITISHNYNESFKSYIHIDINDSKWLWYVLNGFGGAYSFDNNSDCTVHPCFEYEYINKSNDSKNGVISGDFNGSDFDLNISMPQRKRGVKIFR
ncbi:LamG domain-containing protein [Hydrogenimonas thermophila]|uniref:LamG domain-containing protein n=1 Tax=Hydrogenimonas thermophila TaxID=223786 RepID=UPI0029370EF7|nr:LamG domain-containing protein [Hydrogenimonas thermophila]WOE69722.1 LamG domain-containing protein [Hydrogenimonas thermophila]WOE72236.1 LamG domain-containing protein [Hydrogenimonas thermophila]